MSGIRTVEDLLDRCVVDEITGCWRYRGATSPAGEPKIWSAAMGQSVTVGTLIALFTTGAPPGPDQVWRRVCETSCCANPAHRKKSDRHTASKASSAVKSPLHRARISATKRAQSTVCNEQIAAEIRTSTEPLRVFKERYGISIELASDIRRGEQWKPIGVSVFSSWGGLGVGS
jgi:hypothetical protein